MKARGILILLAIFIALAALTAISGILQPQDEGFVTLTRVFPDYTDLDVTAIRLDNPVTGAQLSLVRDTNGIWAAQNMANFDPQAGVNVARTVVLLSYDRVLPPPADGDLSDYGFSPSGVLNVYFVTTSGQTHFVAVGVLNPDRTAYYAIADDQLDILALDRSPVDYLLLTAQQPPVAQ